MKPLNLGTNQSGFMMIQVIIAAAIMGVLSMATASLIQNQVATVNYLEDKLDRLELNRDLQRRLGDPATCSTALSGQKLPSLTKSKVIKQLVDSSGKLLFKSQSSIGKLNIGDMYLTNPNGLTTTDTGGIIELIVPIQRASAGVKDMKPIRITLQTSLASGVVTDCNQQSSCTPTTTDPTHLANATPFSQHLKNGDHQVCSASGWVTVSNGCTHNSVDYMTGQGRKSGGSFFKSSTKYICINGNWAWAGK